LLTRTAVPPGSGGIDFLWTSNGNAPQPFQESAVATIGSSIYVLGGQSYLQNYRYDPTINSWTQIANSPYGHIDGGAAVTNGKIYMIGGTNAQQNIVQIYDPSTDTWSTGAAMHSQRNGVSVVAANQKVYVVGGKDNATGVVSGLVEEYDPVMNTWASKSDMRTARANASAATLNGLIYVMGGSVAGGVATSTTEVLDPTSNMWLSRENMPTPRKFAAVTVLQSKIYMIGGLGNGDPQTLNVVEEFDPAKPDALIPGFHNAWATRNRISVARYGAVAAAVNSSVDVIGGRNVETGSTLLLIEAGTLQASPSIDVPVQAATFGDVKLGNIGEINLAVHNTGNALLTLSYSFPNTGQEFTLISAPSSLATAQSATLRLRLTPAGLGNKIGTLRITSNTPGVPTIDINLSGRAVVADVLPTGQSFAVTSTFSLPGNGHPNYLTLDGNKAYVTMSNPPQLGIVDLATGASAGTTTFTAYPSAFPGLAAVVNGRAYVPLSNLATNAQLAVVSLATNAVLQYIPSATEPHGTAVWNNEVYVQTTECLANGDPSVVQILNTTTNNFVATLPVNRLATWIAIDPQTGRGYASGTSCFGPSSASTLPQVIDANSNAVVGTIDAPLGSQAVAIGGTRAYILESGLVDVVDISSNAVLARIPVDVAASRLAATASFVFVVTQGSNQVTVISTDTNAVVSTVPVQDPSSITADPNTNTAYVLSGTPRTIVAIRLRQPAFGVVCNSSSVGLAPGTTASTNCSVNSVEGYSAGVALSCAGLPQGASCLFTPTAVTPPADGSLGTSLVLSVPTGIVPGIYDFQVTGTDGISTRSANLSATILTCSYIGALSQQSYPITGGIGNLSVGATTGCAWTATTDSSWLTVTAGSSGVGGGSVSYAVAPNPGSASRSGTLTVAGQSFTIAQSGVAAPLLSISKTHVGTFFPGQQNAIYTIVVTNASGAGLTSGTVTVTETLPSGLILVSMSGVGWICPANVCTRSDAIVGGASYPAITVTVNVGSTATSPQVNTASLSGGGSAAATTTDSTVIGSPGTLSVSKSKLNFGVSGSSISDAQPISVLFTAGAAVSWTASSNQPNIMVSPASGIGNGTFQVTATPGMSGIITVTAPVAINSPQQISVNIAPAPPAPSYGSFDTPLNNTKGIAGAIPVTGWALDNIGVVSVAIYREPIGSEPTASNGLVYVGNATFVAGARPDVEATYPNAPLNYRAGWGYSLLTNFLPGGNGTFNLHAIATNKAGQTFDLGTRTITVDNAHASKPFGTIDTPDQGATASGNAFVNFGWALTQNPHCIPLDGSTIFVYIDSVAVGHPSYNHSRSDVAGLFPGLCNSNGAIGFYYVDTIKLANGVHTISWSVTDNAGHVDGVGSRYFTVLNTGTGPVAAPDEPIQVPSNRGVKLRRGFDSKRQAESLSIDTTGAFVIHIEELERIELQVSAKGGHLLVNGEQRPLPNGSTLKNGVFYWQPGAGFLGEYDLLFERPDAAPVRARVVIGPKSYLPARLQ
jgi:uncharacterized repeat protein (TIGR01451 family)